MDEHELSTVMADFLRRCFYNIYFEVEIETASLELSELTPGQKKLRIDLAAWSKLDSSIIFIEAERSLYAKHPLMYSSFADYVYLLCPHASIINETASIKKTQFELLKKNKLGLITLSETGELIERIPPKRQNMSAIIRQKVIEKFIDLERKTQINNGFLPKQEIPWFSTNKISTKININ